MKSRAIPLLFVAVLLLALGCKGDRRRGSSGSRGGDPSGETPRPGAGTPICSNGCERAENGICEDGASGAVGDDCERGTDCSDCGTRYAATTSTERSPAPSCECDSYAGECECECDPDCEEIIVSPDAGTE